jgi:predicted CopG family antitoxin
MARTIMISDRIYEELKKVKGERSFSEVIGDSLASPSRKTVAGLKEIIGILKEDTEYDEVMRTAKKKWKQWGKRYSSIRQ